MKHTILFVKGKKSRAGPVHAGRTSEMDQRFVTFLRIIFANIAVGELQNSDNVLRFVDQTSRRVATKANSFRRIVSSEAADGRVHGTRREVAKLAKRGTDIDIEEVFELLTIIRHEPRSRPVIQTRQVNVEIIWNI